VTDLDRLLKMVRAAFGADSGEVDIVGVENDGRDNQRDKDGDGN
jgi:hypothetical protein